MRRERPAPARFDRSLDLGSRASEHGLDRAVTAIAHPALQATLTRFILDKSAIADALDTAADDDMADHAGPLRVSPTPMTGASDRVIRHIVVRGRVQGVGFRAFVEDEARQRGLQGWVRNRRDGSVEAVFAGPLPRSRR